jgi:signal transduction histidine kinase
MAWSCGDPDTPGKAAAGVARSRPAACFLLALAALLPMLPAGIPVCSAAETPHTFVFLKAQFLLSNDPLPPPASAPWRTVALPHVWMRTDPGVNGLGWYRIEFVVPRVPLGAQAIAIDHSRSWWVDFYVNGARIGGSQDTTGGGGLGFGNPLFLIIPPVLLHPGTNVLQAHMSTRPRMLNIQGLGRVTYGDARAVRQVEHRAVELGYHAWRAFYAMAFSAGLISLFAWLARRSDRVLLWYCIACLSWVAAGAVWNVTHWWDSLYTFSHALQLYKQYGLAVPAAILSFRIARIRWPRLEACLLIFLAAEVLTVLWQPTPLWLEVFVLDPMNAAMLCACATIVLLKARRPIRWPDVTAAVSLVAMGGLILFQPMRFLGWVDVERPILRPYHVPLLIFAIGAAIFDRHVRAIWRMERSNVDLKRRVEEKAREIEAFHAERETRLRHEALIRDRQRILADMHDGLGASLVGLLRYAQAGTPDARGLELRVKEALQELRIAIDALEPAEGDLGSVLGKLRYRLEPLIASAGASLSWDVDELPPVEQLEPSAVFAMQRILLEAVSNAMQHAGARRIRIAARASGKEAICITVEDDGRGFDPAQSSSGHGLANMRRRADALGAWLEIASTPGSGTTVSLTVPRCIAHSLPTAYPEAEAASPA